MVGPTTVLHESPVRQDPDALIREARRRQRRRRAAIGAVVVVVAVITTAVAGLRARQSGSKPRPRPVAPHRIASVGPSPSALGFLSAPYVDATTGGATHTATVWNWNGQPKAVVHSGPVVDCCTTVSLSPDGTRLQVAYGPNGAEVLDLHGRVLFKSPTISGFWADDSRHRCTFRVHPSPGDPTDGPTDLVVIDPSGTEHTIASVGSDHGHGGSFFVRCSIADNQAIVADSFEHNIVSVWQVQLSTGRVSTPAWLPTTTPLTALAISGNGQFAAAGRFGAAPVPTDIINTVTSKVVGRVTGIPIAMSWNGHVVVERRDQDIAAIDWRSGNVSWHTQPGGDASPNVDVAARERSDDLAVAAMNQPGQTGHQAALWLVPANAPARLLEAKVLFGII